jgi:hypothetical protein
MKGYFLEIVGFPCTAGVCVGASLHGVLNHRRVWLHEVSGRCGSARIVQCDLVGSGVVRM